MDFNLDPQIIINGLSTGSIYALIALGFALIFRVTRMVNFAQGDLLMVAGFLALTLYVDNDIPFYITLPATVIIVGLFMVLVERVALRPCYRHGTHYAIISTIGLSFVLLNFAQLVWTRTGRPFPTVFGDDAVEVLGIRFVEEVAVVFIVSLLVMAALIFMLTRTKLGVALRASASDPEVATLMGIDAGRMISLSFFLAGALAALAGVMLAPITYLTPHMGVPLAVKGFVASTIGGLGSIQGAIIGGLLLGIVENEAAINLWDPNYREAVTWALLAAVLLFRPFGIFGEEGAEQRSV